MGSLEWTSFQHDPALLIAVSFAGLVLLVLTYSLSARQRQSTDRERMRRIQSSLDYFTQAAGHLYPAVAAPVAMQSAAAAKSYSITDNRSSASTVILGCKAAPYASGELLKRIDEYLERSDRQSTLLLYRTLEMEISRLTRERNGLLTRGEHPRWGTLFWMTLRPLLPFAALIVEMMFCWQLINELQYSEPSGDAPLFAVMRFVSCSGALLLLYGVIRTEFRESGRRASFVIVTLIICALTLLHILGLTAAPYILVAQILMYAAGYRLTREPKRKERPYAGEYE
ncbi:hypothetical protein [Paenibacillus bovis]|uniref:Uncharacterized protein n=1 Tax=Paenibacillus bovis TaxID=1616788 RepID=A0A172ZCM7_9BACL|nr:hypothetical protein [Paenibacillus bovis]ANF95404.1 hypothetical protein AR543_04845 [Paenibacillus bovis]